MGFIFAKRWFSSQGYFWNSWITCLNGYLKILWDIFGKTVDGDNLKLFRKLWEKIEYHGFSIILSWSLKNIFLAKEDIGRNLEDFEDNFWIGLNGGVMVNWFNN